MDSAQDPRGDCTLALGQTMERDLDRRLIEIEHRLDELKVQLAAISPATASRPVADAGSRHWGEYIDHTLARVQTMANTLRRHAPRSDNDVRDWLVTQAMLADLSAITAHFRGLLRQTDVQTAELLDGIRALGADIETVIENLDQAAPKR
jgi:hypothetical protein